MDIMGVMDTPPGGPLHADFFRRMSVGRLTDIRRLLDVPSTSYARRTFNRRTSIGLNCAEHLPDVRRTSVGCLAIVRRPTGVWQTFNVRWTSHGRPTVPQTSFGRP